MTKNIEKWGEISKEIVFEKYNRKIEKVKYRLPDGEEKDYYLKKEGPAVGILALTKDNQVLLVKQFRPGPNEILDELPGGYVEENETPEQAAERELLEETGYKGKIQLVTTAFDCAYSTMKRYCLVATDCQQVAEQKLDKSEFAEVILMPLNDFRELLISGKNTDLEVGYIGLDYLKLL
ncbi:MAG: NUDIX hydrolase [Candidatus Parcubacteria bacterium]|nr:NUDIX hydrolase [Candidatus Parcubacteria bacterium]